MVHIKTEREGGKDGGEEEEEEEYVLYMYPEY